MPDIILTEYAQFDQNIVIPDNTKPFTQAEIATIVQGLVNRDRYNLNKLNNSPYFTLRNGGYTDISVTSNNLGIVINAYGATGVSANEFAFTFVPPLSANVTNGSTVKTRCRFRIASQLNAGSNTVLYDYGTYQRNGATFGLAMRNAVINLIDPNAVIFEAECVSTFNGVIKVGIVVLKLGPPPITSSLSELSLQSFDVEIY